MNIDNKCKCGLNKFINKELCCINCEINNTHNYLCTKYIIDIKDKKIFYKQNIKNSNPYNEENKIKTLFGKDDYLFLINDACRSLENHCNYRTLFNINYIKLYNEYINSKKILFFMFPNKEIICKEYLPDKYKILNRDKMSYYKYNFIDLFYDSTQLFNVEDFYKTDTHINLKGMIKFYKEACKIISKKLNVDIEDKEFNIKMKEVLGNGDLLQGVNIGTNIAKKIMEKVYYIDNNSNIINNIYDNDIYDNNIYYKKTNNIKILNNNLIDISEYYYEKMLYFEDIKDKILYCKNNIVNKKYNRVVIFYDSFLSSTVYLYLSLFREVYMVKSIFKRKIIENINPDFILEFRIERFLL
jgi:hypothetical protein